MKLYRIKIEDESFIVANDEGTALEEFWERKRAGDFDVDTYLNDITSIDNIDEVEDYLTEDTIKKRGGKQ